MKLRMGIEREERARRIVERARRLFVEIADRHGLSIEWDERSPVELACFLRRQPSLDWDLWLNVQNIDEIGVQHDFFCAEWFPADEPRKESAFIAAVDGLISGDVRLKCHFVRSAAKPYLVDLERHADDSWSSIFRYHRSWRFGRRAVVRIVRNGHAPVTL